MRKAFGYALAGWSIITFLVIVETIYIHAQHGMAGFAAFMQESPHTNVPVTLAAVALFWSLIGLLVWLLFRGKITKDTVLFWGGLFMVAFLYLNMLRERVRYGDIDYYTQAAFALARHEPLPVTYLYPPLWATLLSFLTPLGADGILLICWIANIISLLLFYYLLVLILQHYGFNLQAAALVATIFLLVNMPVMRTLMYIQVNFHVTNFIFLAILCYRERPFFSALALALAVHFKASPLVLVLAFLLELNWKWLAWFVVHILLITLFTVAIYGITPYFDFVNNFIALNQPRILSMHDRSFDSVIGMTLSHLRVDHTVSRVLIYLAKGITGLIALFLCFRSRLFHIQNGNGAGMYNAVIPLLLAMTISSPLVWEHHGIFMTLPALVLLKKMGSPGEWAWYGAAYAFEFLIPTFDYFPWSSYSGLFGLLIFLWLLWHVQKRDDGIFLQSLNTHANFIGNAQAG
jgi:hypothetical protein